MLKKILTTAIFLFLLTGCGGSGGGSSSSDGTTSDGTTTDGRVEDVVINTEISGIDVNANGVRDDIDDYITQHYFNEQQINALLQFAKVIQKSLLVNTNNTKAVQAIDEQDSRALHCIFYTFNNASTENPSTAWQKIRSLSTNTKPRLEAYLKFNHALDGTTSALSEGDTCTDANPTNADKKVVIAFINGILTTKQDAKDSVEYLKNFYGENTPKGKNISYEIVYNDSLSFYGDVANIIKTLAPQGEYERFFDTLHGGDTWYSDWLITASILLSNSIKKVNAGILSLLDNPSIEISQKHKEKIDEWLNGGKKVLFVAQSYGNIFANAAYDYAHSPSVKVVHVAPVSVQTNGAHVLADKDVIVFTINLSIKTLPKSTHDIPVYSKRPAGANGKRDALGHRFVEIYINPALDISKGVRERINEAISSF